MTDTDTVRAQRDQLYEDARQFLLADGSYDISAKAKLHRGQRGFFRDGGLHTLSVLSNGGYEDSEDVTGALYHFPRSHQPSHDRSDVEAARRCLRDRVPIFYIRRISMGPARYHIHYPAWVTAMDDQSELMLIEFKPSFQALTSPNLQPSFQLKEDKILYEVTTPQRAGQARFRMACIQRYGQSGALCGSTEEAILVACHLYPYAEQGSDDARNGLILSANHHLLFDSGLIQFSDDGRLLIREDVNHGRFLAFGIIHPSLHHLPNLPAGEALRASRTRIHKQNSYKPVPPEWLSGIIGP